MEQDGKDASSSLFLNMHYIQIQLEMVQMEIHLSVRADVQTPQVCLLSCELLLSELYMGVHARATVTLFNQTLLPSHFSWMAELQGELADLCSASFEPSSGTLGPNDSLEIKVTFTSHTDVSDESPSALVLDFGDDVILKRAVTKQLLITNQTAIPAPFTIEAEYFNCHASKPNNQSEKRCTYVKKPLHSVQAKKVEDKAQEELVSGLLAHGKGAAFLVLPQNGILGAFETQTVDVTAYTDMWGEYRDLLVCKNTRTRDPSHSRFLTPFFPNSIIHQPSFFHAFFILNHIFPVCIIRFGTHVSGGDTVSRSLRINNPTMFDIRMDWETFNIDQNDGKLVDVVGHADGNELLSGAVRISGASLERNQSPGSEGTSSSLRSMTVIPAKSSGTIHASFTPLTLSGLSVQMEEDGGALLFHASAGDLLTAESEEVTENNSEMPLHFKLDAQDPFLVLRPQTRVQSSSSSNPPTAESQTLLLQPQHSMQTEEELPPGVTLMHRPRGGRKLRLQQNLLIHYSNNSLQTVPLCADLDLVSMRLSSDCIDFGVCHIGQTQTLDVTLQSHGAQTYWKSVIGCVQSDPRLRAPRPQLQTLSPDQFHSQVKTKDLHYNVHREVFKTCQVSAVCTLCVAVMTESSGLRWSSGPSGEAPPHSAAAGDRVL
ncbi:hypothetical protein F7725_029131 [Dissostichus mawsoni]|uniref:Uncharacterized protein n=1 Tax=Dissostichus mawsoni TaxID=36200 RepID=A0A7J5XIA3_DISMA|nr:hypothetical protein F7725_029131 [Dissostichus mawsoni]